MDPLLLSILAALFILGAYGFFFRRGGAGPRIPVVPAPPGGWRIGALTAAVGAAGFSYLVVLIAVIFGLGSIAFLYPRVAAGYVSLGGPVLWLLGAVVLVIAIYATQLGTRLKHLLALIVLVPVSIAAINALVSTARHLPVCAEEDVECINRVRLAEAERRAAELAEANRRAAYTEVTYTDPECTAAWHPVSVSADPDNPTQANPGGNCDWTLRMPGHCIMGKRADRVSDDRHYGPYCDRDDAARVEVKADIEWVWAVNLDGSPASAFEAELRLMPDP